MVLIDGGSRSGKEPVARALQRHGRAVLVGERTAGAVLAGQPFLLSDGSLMFLAVEDVRVDGERLEGTGVTPDVPVPSDLPYAAGRDPQLDRALGVAAGALWPRLALLYSVGPISRLAIRSGPRNDCGGPRPSMEVFMVARLNGVKLLLMAGVIALLAFASPASAGVPGLSVTLESPVNFVGAADDAFVKVTYQNDSKEDLYVLRWQTAAARRRGDIFDVRLDGKPVAYTGRLYKRATPQADGLHPHPGRRHGRRRRRALERL